MKPESLHTHRTMSSTRQTPSSDADRSWLSAAADGDADALDRLAGCWKEDADARATWHRHHLIGDVLRSSELAQPAARDAAFLQGIRSRLAAEPVVLAPVPAEKEPRRGASRWAVPAAVAAGFVVVAGVLVVARSSDPMGAAGTPAMAAASGPGSLLAVSSSGRSATSPAPDSDKLLRDARVDELLRMHQATRGGMVVPGSALRQVDNVVTVEAAR